MNEKIRQLALETIRKGIYKKNIHWLYGPKIDTREFEMVKLLGGSSGQAGWMIQKIYHKFGVQLQTAKDVTDDLLATDFSELVQFDDIVLPSPCVEFYFEDPLLPTILVMKCDVVDLQSWFPMLTVELQTGSYLNCLMQEGSDPITGKQLSLQLKKDMFQDFVENAEAESMASGPFSYGLSDCDNASISFMLQLALKVAVFSSISRFKPLSLTRKQMTKGGKPGVQGRPEKPAFRVTYLPKVIYEKKDVTPSHEGRDFRGRRGFLRFYRDERYVNMKGKWDFIEPIKDPNTGEYPKRSILRVRKPKDSEA